MAKFKLGDDFKIIESGITGKIINQKLDANGDVVEYLVQWDHFSRSCWYPVSEVDDLWELDTMVAAVAKLQAALNAGNYLPRGIDFIPIKIHIDGVKAIDCEHQWDGYCGLHGADEQCVKCNVKRVDIELS